MWRVYKVTHVNAKFFFKNSNFRKWMAHTNSFCKIAQINFKFLKPKLFPSFQKQNDEQTSFNRVLHVSLGSLEFVA